MHGALRHPLCIISTPCALTRRGQEQWNALVELNVMRQARGFRARGWVERKRRTPCARTRQLSRTCVPSPHARKHHVRDAGVQRLHQPRGAAGLGLGAARGGARGGVQRGGWAAQGAACRVRERRRGLCPLLVRHIAARLSQARTSASRPTRTVQELTQPITSLEDFEQYAHERNLDGLRHLRWRAGGVGVARPTCWPREQLAKSNLPPCPPPHTNTHILSQPVRPGAHVVRARGAEVRARQLTLHVAPP